MMLSHPRQKIILDSTGCHMVEHLVDRTVLSARNAPKLLHVSRIKVGNTPSADLSFLLELFHACNRLLKRNRTAPVKQVEIKIINPHSLHARHTALKNVASSCIVRIHFRNEKKLFPLEFRKRLSNQLLRLSISVHLCGVNQRHSGSNTSAKCFLLLL